MNKSLFLMIWCMIIAQNSVHAMGDIYHASIGGDLEQVTTFLNTPGANINQQDNLGRTPLHLAALGHDTQNASVVQFLLDRGADFNREDNYGISPLGEAALSDKQKLVQLMLDHGADVNQHSAKSWAPLHYAAANGYEALVRLLLKRGADVGLQDINGNTPLRLATKNNHQAIIQLINDHVALIARTRLEILTLLSAQHPRIGEHSPAQLMSHYILRDIFVLLKNADH